MGIIKTDTSVSPPELVWLGRSRGQALVASKSEPGLWRLVTGGATPSCTCPGWPWQQRCRHTERFAEGGDAPVLDVLERVRLGTRQELVPTASGWRLLTYGKGR